MFFCVSRLEFCEHCNTLMSITPDGLKCPNCGHTITTDMNMIHISKSKKKAPKTVFSAGGKDDSLIVQRACPKCGNPESYQTITATIGEHAGVNTDRSIIRYKCTKCFHVWIDYSG